MRSLQLLSLFFASAFLSACAPSHMAVTSEPSGATVKVDKKAVGETPVTPEVDLMSKSHVIISASRTGYHAQERVLEFNSDPVRKGAVHFVLMEDQAWKATTTSEATNSWLRTQVDAALAEGDVWQKLVDSVTTRYSSLEQLDNASGYIRTIYQVRSFKGPKAGYKVRTRFISSIASKTPLVYKFRIESEISNPNGDWAPYNRIFKEDAGLIEELQSRLGIK